VVAIKPASLDPTQPRGYTVNRDPVPSEPAPKKPHDNMPATELTILSIHKGRDYDKHLVKFTIIQRNGIPVPTTGHTNYRLDQFSTADNLRDSCHKPRPSAVKSLTEEPKTRILTPIFRGRQ
jgi:hypothetical protein